MGMETFNAPIVWQFGLFGKTFYSVTDFQTLNAESSRKDRDFSSHKKMSLNLVNYSDSSSDEETEEQKVQPVPKRFVHTVELLINNVSATMLLCFYSS